MTKADLSARIHGILTEHLAQTTGFRPEVKDESKLGANLAFDSLDRVEVTMSIEDEFDIELDDEKAAELVTVADLIAYLADLVGVAEVAA